MISLIQKFASTCRATGLRVSTSEVLDCINQMNLVDITDEAQFKTVLRANFVKSKRDTGLFEHLYQLFFHDLRDEQDSVADSSTAEQVREILTKLKEQGEDDIDEAINEFMQGDPGNFLDLLRNIDTREQASNTRLNFNFGQMVGKMNIMLRINQTRDKIVSIAGDNYSGQGDGGAEEAAEQLKNMLETARSQLSKNQKPDNQEIVTDTETEVSHNDLQQRPFSSLTPKEEQEVREAIDKLVKKLKDIVSRRYTKKNRGVLDVSRTLRNSGKFQGVPLEIKFKDKPMNKGSVVTLCDMSGSVWATGRFMLNVLYSLQDCFTKVRSYIFVNNVEEVSEFFNKYEINRAIDKVLSETGLNLSAYTDYGTSLLRFYQNHLHALSSKTTLLIIGDARSNYMNPREDILQELRSRCRRVVWLNPETPNTWNTGDSEMSTYKPYCHELRVCRNLSQLTRFIEDLVI